MAEKIVFRGTGVWEVKAGDGDIVTSSRFTFSPTFDEPPIEQKAVDVERLTFKGHPIVWDWERPMK